MLLEANKWSVCSKGSVKRVKIKKKRNLLREEGGRQRTNSDEVIRKWICAYHNMNKYTVR